MPRCCKTSFLGVFRGGVVEEQSSLLIEEDVTTALRTFRDLWRRELLRAQEQRPLA